MMMTPTDIRYLHDLMYWARRNALAIVHECPECGDRLPEGYLDQLEFAKIHTVIRLDEIGSGEPTIMTIVIGCEGYHIMNELGQQKDDQVVDLSFDIVRTDEG